MALQYYKLKISKVTRETHDAVSISFYIPDEIKEQFKYKHGQFLTIKTDLNGELTKRAYSISSSPYYEDDLTVTVKQIDNGFVSTYLNEHIKAGDILEVMQPRGKFTIDLNSDSERYHVLFSAGSGITPIMSILKSILFVEHKSRVLLVNTNRNQDTIIFSNELLELQKKYCDRFILMNILTHPVNGWEGFKGRINEDIAMKILKDNVVNFNLETHFYLCGPYGLMKEIESTLEQLNVHKNLIHKESYNAGVDEVQKMEIHIPKIDKEKNMPYDIKIKIYNEIHNLTVEPDESVLIAAMREGHDPPFSCQIGACATCRAKLVSGKVEMDERDALTDEEIEEGYILTCQAHPLTDDVFVDYDD